MKFGKMQSVETCKGEKKDFVIVAKRHRTSKVVNNDFESSNLKNDLVSLKNYNSL